MSNLTYAKIQLCTPVGYAHLDTEWRWEYPQVIDEYLRKTMGDNFELFEKYPHYIFNFSGANRYRLMKEYFPAISPDEELCRSGRWFPAGSSMEEGDVNAPSAEASSARCFMATISFAKISARPAPNTCCPIASVSRFPADHSRALRRKGIFHAEIGLGIFGTRRRSGIARENAGRNALQCWRMGRAGWRERARGHQPRQLQRRHRHRSE